jgi:hypothetical protein
MDGAHGEPVIILRGRARKIAGGLGRIQREFAEKGLPAAIGGGDLLELLQIPLTRIRILVKPLDERIVKRPNSFDIRRYVFGGVLPGKQSNQVRQFRQLGFHGSWNGDPFQCCDVAPRLAADTIILGQQASDLFEAHPKVLNAFDKKFVEPGVISPKLLQWGVTILGQWRGIPLYADEQTYENAAGVNVPYVDTKSVLVAASGSQNTMAYAGVPQTNNEASALEVYEGRRIPQVSFAPGEDYRRLRLSSRPVPIPGNTKSWTIIQVVP